MMPLELAVSTWSVTNVETAGVDKALRLLMIQGLEGYCLFDLPDTVLFIVGPYQLVG
jgi:hypothetical protein